MVRRKLTNVTFFLEASLTNPFYCISSSFIGILLQFCEDNSEIFALDPYYIVLIKNIINEIENLKKRLKKVGLSLLTNKRIFIIRLLQLQLQ